MKQVPRDTLCSTCRERPRRPGQRNCTRCHAAAQRQWRDVPPSTIRFDLTIIIPAFAAPTVEADLRRVATVILGARYVNLTRQEPGQRRTMVTRRGRKTNR